MEEKLDEMNQLYVASLHHLFQTPIATTLDTAKEGGWILAVARAFSTQLTSAMDGMRSPFFRCSDVNELL